MMTHFFAAVHHLAVLTLLACVLISLHQLGQPLTVPHARRLRATDMANGLAATVVLVVGLVRVFYWEKGAAFYFHNGPFLAKLGLYGLASVLSLVPTVEMHRWRTALQRGLLPAVSRQKIALLRATAMLQLACLLAMAMCAYLAARGREWPSLG
ncbi:DUF2214 family protein [Rhodoferax aquaticus]|nr:DUF2214 family protein [Rhodoferax aquaticus]